MFYHSYLFMNDMYLIAPMVDTTDNTFVRYGGVLLLFCLREMHCRSESHIMRLFTAWTVCPFR